MTFADLVNDDISAVFTDKDVFGVSVEYHPVEGGKRTVVAVPVDARPSRFENEQYHEVRRQTIQLLFENDDTTGINDPKRGDFIVYLDKKWDFKEVAEEDSDALTLEWQRTKVVKAGRVGVGL